MRVASLRALAAGGEIEHAPAVLHGLRDADASVVRAAESARGDGVPPGPPSLLTEARLVLGGAGRAYRLPRRRGGPTVEPCILQRPPAPDSPPPRWCDPSGSRPTTSSTSTTPITSPCGCCPAISSPASDPLTTPGRRSRWIGCCVWWRPGRPSAASIRALPRRCTCATALEITLWTHYAPREDRALPAGEYASALTRLHAAMRAADVDVLPVRGRVAEALALVDDPAAPHASPRPTVRSCARPCRASARR